jgi:putative NADH-flavin reductase
MITKKIILFGTSGPSVSHLAEETLKRGHKVTVIIPDPNEIKFKHFKLHAFAGNLMNQHEVSKFAHGHDVVICLHEPVISTTKEYIEANRSIIEGAKHAGIHRIISLGYPISLKHERSKTFHATWKLIAEAQHETLKLFKNEDWLRWLYIHSAELGTAHKAIEYSKHNEIHLNSPEGISRVIEINQLVDAILEEAEKTEYILEEDEIII